MLKLPSIIGHRGVCGHAPENTEASFRAAASLGLGCIEFDVKLCADGELIVFHDDTVDRTTSGQGAVESLSLAEIRALDAGSWFSPEHGGAIVPTLAEAIELLAELDMTANIEIKPSPGLEVETARVMCEFLKVNWPPEMPKPLLSSFADAAQMVARDMLPTFERAMNTLDLSDDWAERALAMDAGSVHILHKNLTREQAGIIINAGYSLRSFTVNDTETAERLFDWGLESVFSDFPERIIL